MSYTTHKKGSGVGAERWGKKDRGREKRNEERKKDRQTDIKKEI